DLQGGANATFVVDATIAPTFTGTLSNSADVSMPGVGVDPTTENNVATDETTVVAVTDLSITKTDGTLTATPGGSTTYTMTVVNGGPSAAGGATVTDVLPAGAMSMDWTCTATSGSSCTDFGS